MAKARTDVVCPTCGKEWTWSVDCYNRREAAEWERKHEGEERECVECWKAGKAREREEARHARRLAVAELVKGLGKELAALEGSEKQVAWAEDIRGRVLLDAASGGGGVKPALVDVLNLERRARWWIDNGQGAGGYAVLERLWLEHQEEAEALAKAAKAGESVEK